MKICFLGAGALGSSLGGVLTEAGVDVYLIDPWAVHVEAMARDGLRLREGTEERVVKVRAATDCRGIGPADLIVVVVKSYNTRAAIEQAGPIVGDKTIVLSLQNGLGNEDLLAEVVGKARVLGGRTYAGGVLLGPGHVLTGRKGKQTYIGEMDGTVTDRVRQITQVFTQAGLETLISPNIMEMIWDKLLINSATGALAGITRLPYGELYKLPDLMACGVAAVAEGMAVAQAGGMQLSITDPKAVWFKAAEGLPAAFKPSMLQDVEKGARTEIDFINGAIVREGEKFHIQTPVNRVLVACIKGIEAYQRIAGEPS